MGQKYGQHFLQDGTVLASIADTVFSLQADIGSFSVREIGPGKGVLTKHIINGFEQVRLFEIDTRLKKYLSSFESTHNDLEIIWGDILDYPISHISNPPIIVGNLPYYITSPILRKFFEGDRGFTGGVFLIQREVAEKIQTSAIKKSYLWWILNYCYDVRVVSIVPPTAFDPPPKVDSAVICITKQQPTLSETQFTKMKEFLDTITGLKRKTLGKMAKIRHEKLSKAAITIPEDIYSKRLEELTRVEIEKIVNS